MIQTKILPPTASAYAYPLLIKNLLLTTLTYEPDREIVYRDSVRYDYRGLNERIHRLAGALTTAGLQPGETVAILDWDSHRYLECFFAVPMTGAVLHTVNVRLSREQILYTMNHAEDSVVLVHTDFLPLLESIKDELTTVKKIILLRDAPRDSPNPPVPDPGGFDGADEYEALLAAASPHYDFGDFDENSVATTFYTTGTTGNPKGVYFSHRQLVLHTLATSVAAGSYETTVRFRSDDVYMPITPMFHVHAWGIPYVATMLGAKQVYPGKYEPAALLQLLVREKVTFSHCVPTILHMLVSNPVAKTVDLSRWKVIIGGSALPQGLAKAASDLGIQLITGYGMSETCPILTLTYLKGRTLSEGNAEEQIAYRIKAGLPTPLVHLRIVDEQGQSLPHNGTSVGEVVVRTPWLTQGYLQEPEQSEQLWQDGWLHTGDVASISPEGYLQISDRLKDVIKTGGEWVSSLEIENLISQHEAVSEVAVVGLPDEKWGERPVALVVLKPAFAGRVDAISIKDFLYDLARQGRINEWYVPDRIIFAPEIPKTSVGKIDKKRIRHEVANPLPAAG
ncbi:MAG: fatty acid--CoA ligase [Ferruginibacter sp.]|nr:fatty acid--CoA ligase [Cytophagales bacterium]